MHICIPLACTALAGLASIAFGEPATQPSTRPAAPEMAGRTAEAGESERLRQLSEALQREVDPMLIRPTPGNLHRPAAEDMPPGAQRREYNGFTYYVVPLSER